MIQNQSVLRQYNQRSEGAIHRVIIINVNINYLRLSRSIDRSIDRSRERERERERERDRELLQLLHLLNSS